MWSDWTECDKTCDTGQRHRERQVNVWEKYGGIACSTNLVELKPCNEGLQHLCQKLRNCTVSQWQEWTPCTKTCGTGQSAAVLLSGHSEIAVLVVKKKNQNGSER